MSSVPMNGVLVDACDLIRLRDADRFKQGLDAARYDLIQKRGRAAEERLAQLSGDQVVNAIATLGQGHVAFAILQASVRPNPLRQRGDLV